VASAQRLYGSSEAHKGGDRAHRPRNCWTTAGRSPQLIRRRTPASWAARRHLLVL